RRASSRRRSSRPPGGRAWLPPLEHRRALAEKGVDALRGVLGSEHPEQRLALVRQPAVQGKLQAAGRGELDEPHRERGALRQGVGILASFGEEFLRREDAIDE